MNRQQRASAMMLLGLVLVSLVLPAPQVAQASSAACSDGYALWANGQGRNDILMLSGSNNTLTGALRSNADLQLSGSNQQLTGNLVYTTRFSNAGSSNQYQPPQKLVAAQPPVSYTIADYRSGGVAAEAARSAGRYTVVNGDLDVSAATSLSGLYYVTGNAKLGASQLQGSVTIVAEGMIELSGAQQRLTAYSNGLLLLANKQEPGGAVIKLAGDSSNLKGVVAGPGGMIELSGSSTSVSGMLLGDSLKLSGSGIQLSFDGSYCPQPVSGTDSSEYSPSEVLVKLYHAADLAAVASANGLNPQPLGQFGSRPIFRLAISDGSSPQAKAEQLRPASGTGGDPRVEYAEPNYLAEIPEGRRGRGSWVIGTADSQGYAQQWAPDTIRLAVAHGRTNGAGVIIAVLDTGVDQQHPALAGRLMAGYDFVDDDSNPREEGNQANHAGYGHGTHVAGLLALAAPGARIMPVRVLDPDGMGNLWVMAEALLFAAERGPDGQPQSGDEAHVINLSLGTLRQTYLLETVVALAACDDDGIAGAEGGEGSEADDEEPNEADEERCMATGGAVVVAAAGNSGDTTPQYPAAEPVAGALAVGASTRSDTRAEFSTYGPWVALAAPGEAIVSATPGGGYASWSGTSMAAPLVAATAALVRAAEPGLSAVAIAERLRATAQPICGAIAWRLDAAAAVGVTSVRSIHCNS